jgi:tetratricopeptide (TPR) repeat protein
VFAVHPLRVESVAWVAERKDVLSGVFFMLTIGAYVRFVKGPSTTSYCLVVFLFALGLMCKPMLVTLPFVLLLLDYWPLNRFEPLASKLQPASFSRLVFEKLPLLALAAVSCAVTIFAQRKAMSSFGQVSLPVRADNSLISCLTYLEQMFWPSRLAVLYPFPIGGVPLWETILASAFLLSISAGILLLRKARPYLLVGWLWYLIMLLPVIGILQVGAQARADRYTYLPQIGICLLLVWAAADFCADWRQRRAVLGCGAAFILAALIVCARTQTSYWLNSEVLWTHTIACTSDNYFARNNLGNALLQNGKVDESIVLYNQALQIMPEYAEAKNNLGNALLKKGNVDQAIALYEQALHLRPDFAEAHSDLGSALVKKGKMDEAIAQLQQALQIKPGFADAHNNLGTALVQKGKTEEAFAHFQKALEINPDDADACDNLGLALLQKGNVDEAISHFQQAVQIKPRFADAHYNLGSALVQKGKIDAAIAHYEQALQIKPDYPDAHYNLGLALLQKGMAEEAMVHFQQALQFRPGFAEAHNNLGYALFQKGDVDNAIAHYQQALQIKPDYAKAHNNLGNALLQKGNVEDAIAHYQQALQIRPDYLEAKTALAWVLATAPQASLRNGEHALALARQANQQTGGENPAILRTLAAAYAETGRFDDAQQTARQAISIAQTQGQTDIVQQINTELQLYTASMPFHQQVR